MIDREDLYMLMTTVALLNVKRFVPNIKFKVLDEHENGTTTLLRYTVADNPKFTNIDISIDKQEVMKYTLYCTNTNNDKVVTVYVPITSHFDDSMSRVELHGALLGRLRQAFKTVLEDNT